jgi:APA family basic amino acid/polyamine antiporter
MIGSGIFIVSADMAPQTGSPSGLLMGWVVTAILTAAAALLFRDT